MKKKPNSRRVDFIPNRLNKYSIRKFTVGTASIIIGSLIFLGQENEAQAEETTTSSTTHITDNGNINKVTAEKATENTTSEEVPPVAEPAENTSNDNEINNETTTTETPVTDKVEDNTESTNEEPVENTQTDKEINKEESNTNDAVTNTATDTDDKESTEEASEQPSGTLVNDKVNTTEFNFNSQDINPNNSGHTSFNSKFQVDGEVKSGDYFTFKLPQYLTADGDVDYSNLNNIMNLPELKNANGDVIATGMYNTTNKTGTYTFTDFINGKKNINGQFELPLFTDRKNAPQSGEYPLEFDVAGETFNEDININYGSPVQGNRGENGSNITSFITEIDLHSGQNEYTQSIYVNPKGNKLNYSTVKIQGYHEDPTKSSTLIDENNTSFKVYEVQDNTKLTDSYYINPEDSNYVDVTNQFSNAITYRDNTATIDFSNTSKTYVVVVDGHFDNSGESVRTRVTHSNTDYYGNQNTYYWDNENIVKQGSGSGDGDDDSDSDADADSDSDADSDNDGDVDHDMVPGSNIDNGPHSGSNVGKAASTSKDGKSNKTLPDTGEENTQNGLLFGGLFAGLGSLLLFGRRRKKEK